MEGGLELFQRDVVARDVGNEVCKIVAVAVDVRDSVAPGGRLPGYVITAGHLDRADQRPVSELAGIDGRAIVFELGTVDAAADGIEKIVVSDLHQAGRCRRSG